MIGKPPVYFFHLNKCIRKPDHPLLLKSLVLSNTGSSIDTRQRKKCRPTEFILLQKRNHPFCRLFIICYDVLDTSSKGSLHRNLIRFVHFDQIRNNT